MLMSILATSLTGALSKLNLNNASPSESGCLTTALVAYYHVSVALPPLFL